MSPWMPRKRLPSGDLVCKGCESKHASRAAAAHTAAGAWPVMPGVPAAGHVASNGFWHPGSVDNCDKTPCSERTSAKVASTDPGWVGSEDPNDERGLSSDFGGPGSPGEARIRPEFGADDQPTGRWEWDAFRYDDLPQRADGIESSLAEAKARAEEYVRGGQMSLFASRRRQAAWSITCWNCGGEGDVANGVVCDVCRGTGLVEESNPRRYESTRKVAHDSGDGETIYHCPFCGAGQVVGRSDGTAECQFCQTTFTVQVQPSYSTVPQTIDGVPHVHPDMPGADPGTVPEEEAPVETETDVEGEGNPIFAKRAARHYLTAEGYALDEDAYLRHLAIAHAEDRMRMAAAIKAERRATAISFYDGRHTDSTGRRIEVGQEVTTPDGSGRVGAVYPDTPYYEGRTVQVEMVGSPGYAGYGDWLLDDSVERDVRRFRPEQVTVQ